MTRIAEVRLVGFKRFADLTIQSLPYNARLVLLAGPNGNGKSSLFDGMLNWRRRHGGMGNEWDPDYHARDRTQYRRNDSVTVKFHAPEPKTGEEIAASIHFRAAHRNDPTVRLDRIEEMPPITKDLRFTRLNANDAGVLRNLKLLVGQELEILHSTGDPSTTFGQHRNRLQGLINDAFARLGLKLTMDGLGNPLQSKTFRFSKGNVSGYHFDNLSGGERAVFDLLFDLIVQREAFGDAIYCIDEPESHVNPNLHGHLLDCILSLVPQGGQLWVATHSIGMLRAARDMQRAQKDGQIIFLDFDQDFDKPATLIPIRPDRQFWKRALSTAIGDVADLVAPETIIFCEGKNSTHELGSGTDAKIYEKIFAGEAPDAVFTSLGASNDVEGRFGDAVSKLFATIKGSTVLRLVDGDIRSDSERADLNARGIRVLSRRHIESYLFDEEVIRALCISLDRGEALDEVLKLKQRAINASIERGNSADDVKRWCSEFRAHAARMLGVSGQTDHGFMLDVLAPRMTKETAVYRELWADIFGD